MTDADDDVAQAVIAGWKADQGLAALFAQPPTYGKAVRKDPARDSKATVLYPYAKLTVTKDRDQERMTGGVYFDYRRVTLSVTASPKALAVQAKLAVLKVFNLNLGVVPGGPTLTMPSGALFKQWWPLNEGEIAEEEQSKDGQEVWTAKIIGRVWTVRTV